MADIAIMNDEKLICNNKIISYRVLVGQLVQKDQQEKG